MLVFGFYLFKIKKGERKEVPVKNLPKEKTFEEIVNELTSPKDHPAFVRRCD
jgi:hypothetical protein